MRLIIYFTIVSFLVPLKVLCGMKEESNEEIAVLVKQLLDDVASLKEISREQKNTIKRQDETIRSQGSAIKSLDSSVKVLKQVTSKTQGSVAKLSDKVSDLASRADNQEKTLRGL